MKDNILPSRSQRTCFQQLGQAKPPNKLDEFAASLPHPNVPITETWTTPFWHQPAVFLFGLLCFVAERGLRRWKGLA